MYRLFKFKTDMVCQQNMSVLGLKHISFGAKGLFYEKEC